MPKVSAPHQVESADPAGKGSSVNGAVKPVAEQAEDKRFLEVELLLATRVFTAAVPGGDCAKAVVEIAFSPADNPKISASCFLIAIMSPVQFWLNGDGLIDL